MTTGKKLFWGFVVLEFAAAGWVGWQMANAQLHPWARQSPTPKRPIPKPIPIPK
jgi:hypothetical protein